MIHGPIHKSHPFHLVNPSPWPLFSSFSAFSLALSLVTFMHDVPHGGIFLLGGLFLVALSMFFWFTDIVNEGLIDKAHNNAVQNGIRWGMLLFILSELTFFAAFFWSFFYHWLYPVKIFDGSIVKDGIWPPPGIETIGPGGLPILNTVILLLSGTTITWAHHAVKEGKKKEVTMALSLTVALGILFSLIQAYEYHHASFGLRVEGYASSYASVFYICTGFHGAHVLIGTAFLLVCLIRNMNGTITSSNHMGLEFAAWYWHFVDAVWLFLFIFLYCLAS